MNIRLTGNTCTELWPQLYRFFQRRGFSTEDAEDLTQDLIARIWARMPQFENRDHLRGYVFAAARNAAARCWARDRRRFQDELADSASPGPDPCQALQVSELELEIRANISRLDPCVGDILDPDSPLDDYNSAASRYGVSVGSLRTRVCRTRKELRIALADLLAA